MYLHPSSDLDLTSSKIPDGLIGGSMSIDQVSRIESCIENTFRKFTCEPVEYQDF